MKRLLVPILVLAVSMTGCMDVVMDIDIKKDWSGDIEAVIKMREFMVQMAEQSGEDLGISEAALRKELEKAGGRLNSYESRVEGEYRVTEFDTWYPDLRPSSDDMMTFTQEGDVAIWRFNGDQSDLGEDLEQMRESFAMLEPMLAGVKLDIRVTVPELISTNMEKVDANTLRYFVDLDALLADKTTEEKLEALKGLMRPKEVRFKME